MEKIWSWWNDDEFKDYEEYQSKLPETLLDKYGEQLEKDSNNLLTYEIVPITMQNDTLDQVVILYIIVNDNHRYNIRVFEITYPFDNVYPCKFYSMLTENKYESHDYEELKKLIEIEIQDKKTMKALSGLIRHFYDKETIEKAMKMSE